MADLQYPHNIEEMEMNGGSVLFTLYDRPNSQTSNIASTIQLYMPQTLENPMNISWDQVSGFTQKVANKFAGMSWDQAMEALKSKSVGDVVSAGVDELLRYGRTVVPGEQIINTATKSIANPYIAMTFRGVNFRTFEMVFKFTPHTEEESDVIKDIIKEFRKAALPTGCSTTTMGFPSEVDIEYVGLAEPWLNRFKRCVITDLHVNYTGAGFYAAMQNGFPAETELRLQFTENELVCREDVEEGY